MAELKEAEALLKMLKKQASGSSSTLADGTLRKIKIALTKFSSMPPSTATSASSKKERLVGMQAYEAAVALSLKKEDLDALERAFKMLRPFYFEYRKEIGDSKQRHELLGLELLFFLVQSRLAEFYSFLEMLDQTEAASKPVRFVTGLEQFLMEGSYNGVLAARKNSPSKMYSWLLENLETTVRDEVANCLEVAYPSMKISSAQKLMKFSGKSDLMAYIETKENWKVESGTLVFVKPVVKNQHDLIPAKDLIRETLQYANDLERIV